MSVYKPCDIRGPIEELTPELYYRWGCVLGSLLPEGARCVTGGDVRPSTREFLPALEKGLCDTGAHVVSTGIQPTPIVYFVKRTLPAHACAIVTASHSPADVNGLKWMIGDLPPDEDDVKQLRQLAETADWSVRRKGTVETYDPIQQYGDWLRNNFHLANDERLLSVILDFGNGCWANCGARLYTSVFPKFAVKSINSHPDGIFPSRVPDCSKPEHMKQLAEKVLEYHADLGIAFDGDGDRVGFVDETGTPLVAEEATYILIQSFGGDFSGGRFVYDLKFSDTIPAAARAAGASPIPERSGHTFIRSRMIQEDALFGAEISGHYFYRELNYGDDGLFTACRLTAYLTRTGIPFSKLRENAPKPFITPDIRLEVQPDAHAFVERVKRLFADLPLSFVDGVRVDFPTGWALARPSVTENKVTFRFEGTSQENLGKTIAFFTERLKELREPLQPLLAKHSAPTEP